MTDVNNRIRARVDAFVDEISELVREAALKTINDALAGRGGAQKIALPASLKGGRGNNKSPATRGGGGGAKKSVGGRRSPEALIEQADQVVAYLRSNPGQRVEQIGKALGYSSGELALPVKKLLDDKQISKKGVRRGTTYFAK